jgi:hypothetical protein
MPSFIEGVASTLGGGLERRAQGMLELSMLSKKIEMEQQARQSEMAQQHQYSLISGQQGSSVLGALGVSPEKTGPLAEAFPEGMPEGVLRDVTQTLGMQYRAESMMNRPQHFATKPDANNLITNGFVSPMTGTWLGQPQTTLDPKALDEIQKIDNQVGNAKNMIQGINQRAQNVLANAPAGVPLQRLNAYWQAHGMPTNPDLKAFTDSLGSLSAQYIKDTTGMAPRSLQLMELDMGAFPNATDDGPSALQKTQILNQTMSNKAQTAHMTYDPTNYLQSPLHPKSQQPEQAMPSSGGYTATDFAKEDMRRQSLKGPKQAK